MNSTCPLQFRQFCAIQMKNSIKSKWDTCPDKDSKEYIRTNIFQALYSSPRLVSVQLGEVIVLLIRFDYPKRWHSLPLMLKTIISDNSHQVTPEFLFVLQSLATIYRNERRNHSQFTNILKDIFVPFQLRLEALVSSIDVTNEQAGSLLDAYLKVYRQFTKTSLPQIMRKQDSMMRILKLMTDVIQLHLPPSCQVCFFCFVR